MQFVTGVEKWSQSKVRPRRLTDTMRHLRRGGGGANFGLAPPLQGCSRLCSRLCRRLDFAPSLLSMTFSRRLHDALQPSGRLDRRALGLRHLRRLWKLPTVSIP